MSTLPRRMPQPRRMDETHLSASRIRFTCSCPDGLRKGGSPSLLQTLAAWFKLIALSAGPRPSFSEVSFERVVGRPGSDLVGHLRLFTSKATREFLDYHGFDLVDVKGAPFGALPRGATTIDRLLARSPSLAAITVVLARSRP